MNSRALAIPLALVALLGGVLGFSITRVLEPTGPDDGARVSVVRLPSTPTPEPSATPESKSESRVTVNGRSGSSSDGRCPAGCQCEFPPNGMIVICR